MSFDINTLMKYNAPDIAICILIKKGSNKQMTHFLKYNKWSVKEFEAKILTYAGHLIF